MDKVVTAAQMKKLDEYMIREIGIPSMVLMERAALASVEEFFAGGSEPMESESTESESIKSKSAKWGFDMRKVLCVCGAGNNGGDGFAVARLLFMKGIDTEILFVGKRSGMSSETSQQCRIAENYGIKVYENEIEVVAKNDYSSMIDGIFGIGLTRNVEGIYKDLIDSMNAQKDKNELSNLNEKKDINETEDMNAQKGIRILALDIPSGLSADTGEVMGAAVRADKTVTFAFNKIGLTYEPAREYTGEVIVKDIGIY